MIKQIYLEERGKEGGGILKGVRALYRGAAARVAFHIPNTAITMALFERSKQWWAQYLR